MAQSPCTCSVFADEDTGLDFLNFGLYVTSYQLSCWLVYITCGTMQASSEEASYRPSGKASSFVQICHQPLICSTGTAIELHYGCVASTSRKQSDRSTTPQQTSQTNMVTWEH